MPKKKGDYKVKRIDEISDIIRLYDNVILTFTDGSTSYQKQSNFGGCGMYFYSYPGAKKIKSHGEPYFLNPVNSSRCEIYSVIIAIQKLAYELDFNEKKHTIIILSDSEYVVKAMNIWMPVWKEKGMKKANKKPVENQDLLIWLDKLLMLYKNVFDIKFYHIYASHDWTPPPKDTLEYLIYDGNLIADDLAVRSRDISIKMQDLV